MSRRKQIISVIESRDDFFTLLKRNPGLIVIKLGADWCGPVSYTHLTLPTTPYV